MAKCKKVDKMIKGMELLGQSLGVSKDEIWNTHAEVWHACWDCGVSLTDSKIHTDPTCPACGRVWEMS